MLPNAACTVIEFERHGLWGVVTVNSALRTFQGQQEFPWHLSISMQYADLAGNRLPSHSEQELLNAFEDKLDPCVTNDRNGVFLARVTHNGLRELVWRIRAPETINALLQNIIRTQDHPRPFDYRIDDDPGWEKAAWFLDNGQ